MVLDPVEVHLEEKLEGFNIQSLNDSLLGIRMLVKKLIPEKTNTMGFLESRDIFLDLSEQLSDFSEVPGYQFLVLGHFFLLHLLEAVADFFFVELKFKLLFIFE